MKEESQKLLQRAADCLSDAEANLALNRWVVGVNRAYYAVFDCARALLAEKEIYARTHQGVYVKFNETFVKTNIFDPVYQQTLKQLFDLRQSGDYDIDAVIEEEDAQYACQYAKQFLEATTTWFSDRSVF